MPDDRGPERNPLGHEVSSNPHKNQSPPPGSLAHLTARQLTESAELLEQIQDITVSIAETIGAKLLGLELQARCMSQAAAAGERDRVDVWRIELQDNADQARRLTDRLIESTRSNRARSRIRAAIVNLDAGNLVDGPGVRQLAPAIGEPARYPTRSRSARRRGQVAAIAAGIAIAGVGGALIRGTTGVVASIAGAVISMSVLIAHAATSAPGEWK